MKAEGPTRRTARFEKLIRQVTSEFLIHRVTEMDMGFVNVSRVFVSGDLRNAKVYLHITDSPNPKQDLEALQAYTPELQRYIHSQVRSKYCPRVQFVLDESYEKVLKVERLLHEISVQRESGL